MAPLGVRAPPPGEAMAWGAREEDGWVRTLKAPRMERWGEEEPSGDRAGWCARTQKTSKFWAAAVVSSARLLPGGDEVMVMS